MVDLPSLTQVMTDASFHWRTNTQVIGSSSLLHPSRIDIGVLAAIIQSAELEEDNAEDYEAAPGLFDDEDDW